MLRQQFQLIRVIQEIKVGVSHHNRLNYQGSRALNQPGLQVGAAVQLQMLGVVHKVAVGINRSPNRNSQQRLQHHKRYQLQQQKQIHGTAAHLTIPHGQAVKQVDGKPGNRQLKIQAHNQAQHHKREVGVNQNHQNLSQRQQMVWQQVEQMVHGDKRLVKIHGVKSDKNHNHSVTAGAMLQPHLVAGGKAETGAEMQLKAHLIRRHQPAHRPAHHKQLRLQSRRRLALPGLSTQNK
jgi:hypothetical protein